MKSGDCFYDEAEADVVWKVRYTLLRGGCVLPEDIGILTWYDAQNKHVCNVFDMSGSTVANVDGFQGSERPVMFFIYRAYFQEWTHRFRKGSDAYECGVN